MFLRLPEEDLPIHPYMNSLVLNLNVTINYSLKYVVIFVDFGFLFLYFREGPSRAKCPIRRTENGGCCDFPFVYKNSTHNTCVTANAQYLWCQEASFSRQQAKCAGECWSDCYFNKLYVLASTRKCRFASRLSSHWWPYNTLTFTDISNPS